MIDPSILYEYKFSDRMSASFNAEVINSSGKYKYRYKRVYPNTHQVMYDTTAVRQNGDVFSTRIEAGLYGKIPEGFWRIKVTFITPTRVFPEPL